MFDYSYLDRISSESTDLHLEVLEVFLVAGKKLELALQEPVAAENKKQLFTTFSKLYSNLRILGMEKLLVDAELLETSLRSEASDNKREEQRQAFAERLKIALSQAEDEIQRLNRKG
ncbi:MAG: hypothetical protein GYB31_16680 [Bacteroidetes bacterium]|nr:hypothetical protein [Bacteroidota bacterium]